MSYYDNLHSEDKKKFVLINRILNAVRIASGKPPVYFAEIEKN